jgi:hypothetical protein
MSILAKKYHNLSLLSMNINPQIVLKFSQLSEIKGYLQIQLKPTLLECCKLYAY